MFHKTDLQKVYTLSACPRFSCVSECSKSQLVAMELVSSTSIYSINFLLKRYCTSVSIQANLRFFTVNIEHELPKTSKDFKFTFMMIFL